MCLTVCWCQSQRQIEENTSRTRLRKRKLVKSIFFDLIWVIRKLSILRSDWCILRRWRFMRLVWVIDERVSSRRCVIHESNQTRVTFVLITNWHALVIVLKTSFLAWFIDWESIQKKMRIDCLSNVWFWRIYFIQLCFFSLEIEFRFRRRSVLSFSLFTIVLHELAISFYSFSNLSRILVDVCSWSRWASMKKM
jgi:hypothetical protein